MNPGDHSSAPHVRAAAESRLPALDWMHRANASTDILLEVQRQLRRRKRRRLAAASAACAVLLVLAVGWGRLWRAPATPPVLTASATVLWPVSQTLPDGSVVELRGDSHIELDFRPEVRRVVLCKGEAHFQVTRNPERPFVVVANQVEVRAVGTAFAVELAASKVQVLVTEGRVAVSGAATTAPEPRPHPSTPPQAIVDAGNRCVVAENQDAGPQPQVEALTTAEINDRLSWRVPQLEFSRAPLTEIVQLMNAQRGTAHRITFVIGDAELRHVKLSGFLRADNVEGLVRLLELNFGVLAERSGDEIVLHRAAQKGQP